MFTSPASECLTFLPGLSVENPDLNCLFVQLRKRYFIALSLKFPAVKLGLRILTKQLTASYIGNIQRGVCVWNHLQEL